jgi:hypothetical protein
MTPPRRLASLAAALVLVACGSRPPPNGPTHEHEHCHGQPGGERRCHTHPHDDAHPHDGMTGAPSTSASTSLPTGAPHEHEHCHERAAGRLCHTHPHDESHHPPEPPPAKAP